MKIVYLAIPFALILVGLYLHMNRQIKQDMLEMKYGFIKKCFSDFKCINEVKLPPIPSDPNFVNAGDDLIDYGYERIFKDYKASIDKINISEKFRNAGDLKKILLTHDQENIGVTGVRPNRIIAIESNSGHYTLYLLFRFSSNYTLIDVYENSSYRYCYRLNDFRQSDFFFD